MAESQTQSDTYSFQSLEIIVGVALDEAPEENVAVAEAIRHVSAHIQDFAVDCDIWRIETYGEGKRDWGIGIKCDYIHKKDSQLKEFMDGLVETPNVETVEKIF